MTDARIPERWLNDRRFARLGHEPFHLYILAITWSVANRTDGVIESDDLDLIAAWATGKPIELLVNAGLWTEEVEGKRWLITDYSGTQTSSHDLQVLDNARRHEREKKARQRAHQRGDHSLCRPDTCSALSPGTSAGTSPRTALGQDRTGQAQEVGDQQDEPVTGLPACPGCWAPLVTEESQAAGKCHRCREAA